MKFKKADGRVIYLPVKINCNKFCTIAGEDGFVEKVICAILKKKTECKTCSLNSKKHHKLKPKN